MAITKNIEILRLEIGDTDESLPLFTDEELTVFLTRYGLTANGTGAEPSILLASAADACEALATRFASEFDFAEDGQTFNRSQRSSAYTTRAAELRSRSSAGGGYSVGITSSVLAAVQDAA